MKLTKTFMVKTMLDANFPDALIGYDSGLFAVSKSWGFFVLRYLAKRPES